MKLITNDLLPVYESDTGERVVDGRELHEYLEVGTRFNDWMARQISKFGFSDGEDFYSFLSKSPDGGRPTTEYTLRLDMAKELAMVESNDKGSQARKYFIEIEKRFKQNRPQSQLEILQASIGQLVDQERRMTQLESRVQQTEHKQEQITEILSLNPTEWRKKLTTLLNRISQSRNGDYEGVRQESYQLLEERAKCDLSIRLTNKRRRMLEEGISKSKVAKTNRIDVIAEDARLTEIYLAIVKEMAIRNNVNAA